MCTFETLSNFPHFPSQEFFNQIIRVNLKTIEEKLKNPQGENMAFHFEGKVMSNKVSPDELKSRERNSTLQLPKEESTSNYMSSEYMYLLS